MWLLIHGFIFLWSAILTQRDSQQHEKLELKLFCADLQDGAENCEMELAPQVTPCITVQQQLTDNGYLEALIAEATIVETMVLEAGAMTAG